MNSDILTEISTICLFENMKEDILVLCFDHAQARHLLNKLVDILKEQNKDICVRGTTVKCRIVNVIFKPYNDEIHGYSPNRIYMDKATSRLYMKFVDIKNLIDEINRR